MVKELCGIDPNLYFSLHPACEIDAQHPRDVFQVLLDVFRQRLEPQGIHGAGDICDEDRPVAGVDLDDLGVIGIWGQLRLRRIDFFSDLLDRFIEVDFGVEFDRDQGDAFGRRAGESFEVSKPFELLFDRLCDQRFDIRWGDADVGGANKDHRNGDVGCRLSW